MARAVRAAGGPRVVDEACEAIPGLGREAFQFRVQQVDDGVPEGAHTPRTKATTGCFEHEDPSTERCVGFSWGASKGVGGWGGTTSRDIQHKDKNNGLIWGGGGEFVWWSGALLRDGQLQVPEAQHSHGAPKRLFAVRVLDQHGKALRNGFTRGCFKNASTRTIRHED